MNKRPTPIEWFRIFRQLDDSRAPITKMMLYISFGFTLLSAILGNLSSSGDAVKVLASIILSISTSVTAAALVDIFFRMRADERFKRKQKVFRTLFNCDLDTQNVAIVIPRYDTSKDEITEDIIDRIVGELPPPDFSNWKTYKKAATLTKTYKDITISDIYSASFCDIVAAAHLIAAFAENQLPVPDIIWDTEVENELKAEKYKTFISIGLFSNSLTASVNELSELPQRMFRLQVGSKTDSELYDFCRILLQWPDRLEDSWKEFLAKSRTSNGRVNGVIDVALWAKVPFHGKSVIICGGTTAEATQKLGNYIYKNWQDISLWRDPNTVNQPVGDASWYAITFAVDVYKKDNPAHLLTDVSGSEVRVMV